MTTSTLGTAPPTPQERRLRPPSIWERGGWGMGEERYNNQPQDGVGGTVVGAAVTMMTTVGAVRRDNNRRRRQAIVAASHHRSNGDNRGPLQHTSAL
jgi:hypothetical protein